MNKTNISVGEIGKVRVLGYKTNFFDGELWKVRIMKEFIRFKRTLEGRKVKNGGKP